MSVGVPQPVTGKRFCLDDRYNIDKLGELIGGSSAEGPYTKESIEAELKTSANLHGVDEERKPLDKLSKQHIENGFHPEESISSREAYLYIRRLAMVGRLTENSLQGHVGRALHRIYYADSLFAREQAPIPVKISKVRDAVHDVDTIKIEDAEPAQCNAGPSTISNRISEIDGPEVGYYYDERYAVVSREDYALQVGKEGGTYEYPYGREAERDVKKYRALMKGKKRFINGKLVEDKRFINGKLVGDVDKVHLALSKGDQADGIGPWDPKGISYWDRTVLNNAIAAAMMYAGKMATVIGEDLLNFERDSFRSHDALLYGAQSFWEIPGAPPIMCGALQPFDDHGRSVGGLVQEGEASRSLRFMATRLPELIEEKEGELIEFLEKRLEFVRKQLAEGKVKNENVRKMVEHILAKTPRPRDLYNKTNVTAIAVAFQTSLQTDPKLAGDYQAVILAAGAASYYGKYPGKMREAYKPLSQAATSRKFGIIGNDFVVATLRKVNEGKKSHNPKLCVAE